MDGHVYMKNYKKKPMNVKYALVEYNGSQHVFDSIYKAESYCQEQGIDPDENIQSWSPEVLAICRKISFQKVEALDEVVAVLTKLYEKEGEIIDQKCAITKRDREECEKNHTRNFSESYNVEQVNEAVGIHHGVYEALKAIREMREPYQNIIWYATGV